LIQRLREEAERRGLLPPRDPPPLWPDEYCRPDARSAWSFVVQLRTWNEAESATQPFPDRRYLRRIAREWVRCWRKGQPILIEKSRRLVTSWLLRALELWVLGLKRGDGVIVHRTHSDAAEHVWRIWHLYDDLRKRNPDWGLLKPTPYGSLADKQLDSVVLPNGSRVEKHFEKPEGLQGSGYTFVTMEEISLYRRPGSIWAQARFVTQASAGSRNGLIVGVTNSSPNTDYQELKCKASPRRLLGME
jgi:hypothetical protein